jgi:hypothetical protein
MLMLSGFVILIWKSPVSNKDEDLLVPQCPSGVLLWDYDNCEEADRADARSKIITECKKEKTKCLEVCIDNYKITFADCKDRCEAKSDICISK